MDSAWRDLVLKSGEVVSFGEQIVMIFEATHFDAGATVVSPRRLVPAAARPVMPPPPPPVEYVGSVPANPAPVPIPGTVNIRRSNPVLIVVAVGVFLFLYVRGIFLVGGLEFPLVHVLPVPGRLLEIFEVFPPRVR